MSEPTFYKKTMTEPEFCRAVGISTSTAYRLRMVGRLGYYRVGKKILYGQKHIRDFLADFEREVSRARVANGRTDKR